jgi:hypothetical protein
MALRHDGQPAGADDVEAVAARLNAADDVEPAPADVMDGLLARVSPTWASAGESEGHDLTAAARLVDSVRDVLVQEVDGVLALLPDPPARWYGGNLEVHDLPTTAGRLSYAVRWHGPRPALLWELELLAGAGPVRLTAPGLDPAWQSVEARGDALLAPGQPPAPTAGAPASGSFS